MCSLLPAWCKPFLAATETFRSSLVSVFAMTLEEFINNVEYDASVKNDVYMFLMEQGITSPLDLGFLANAKGDVSESLVRNGCPATWRPEHHVFLSILIRMQAPSRHGVVGLALSSSTTSPTLGPGCTERR